MLLPSPLPCDTGSAVLLQRQRPFTSTPTSTSHRAAPASGLATSSCRALQAILGNTPFALSLPSSATAAATTSSSSSLSSRAKTVTSPIYTSPFLTLSSPKSTTPRPRSRQTLSRPEHATPRPHTVAPTPRTHKRRRSSFEADSDSTSLPLLYADAEPLLTTPSASPKTSRAEKEEEQYKSPQNPSDDQPSTPKRQRRPSSFFPPTTLPSLAQIPQGISNEHKSFIEKQQHPVVEDDNDDAWPPAPLSIRATAPPASSSNLTPFLSRLGLSQPRAQAQPSVRTTMRTPLQNMENGRINSHRATVLEGKWGPLKQHDLNLW